MTDFPPELVRAMEDVFRELDAGDWSSTAAYDTTHKLMVELRRFREKLKKKE